MSNKDMRARVANAFRAMKAMGIHEDKVKPVLKNLLRLYDKNWVLIEEGNYRVLADAIFEGDELQAAERAKKILNDHTEECMEEESQVAKEPEHPLKRLRPRYQNGKKSSLDMPNVVQPRTPLFTPKEEPNDLPDTHPSKANGSQGKFESPQPNAGNISVKGNKGKQPIPPKPLSLHEKSAPSQPNDISRSQPNTQSNTKSGSNPHPMRLRDRGKGPVYYPPSRRKRRVPESSSGPACLREPNSEAAILLSPKKKSTVDHGLIKPEDERITNMQCLEVPGVTIHPDTSNGGDSSSRYGVLRGGFGSEPSALQTVSASETSDDLTGEPVVVSNSSCNFEIASSSLGEVKVSLCCNLSPGRPDFKVTSLEAVLKYVEDKCLRSPITLDPNISLMNLMEELCQGFLKLGTDQNSQFPKTIDSVSKSFAADARGAKVLSGTYLNKSVGSRSVVKAPRPKTPAISSTCNGTNDGHQLNKMDAEEGILRNGETQENCTKEMEKTKRDCDVVDIAKGQEKVVITLVNEVNDENPPSFHYIPQNVAFQDAYVNFSLARIGDSSSCATCSGDCLSLSTPCACSYETGGEFAYTRDGLVKEEILIESISMNRDPEKHCQFFCKECPLERSKSGDIIEPCKGHLVRRFIKECWWKCGCNKQCGNRVVQRGITRKLQVFMTPGGKGWGLRTLEDLPKGAFVCEYVGEVLTNAELFERVLRSPAGEKHSYPVLLDADWCAEGVLKDEESLCLDATYYGNVARFINHRCHDSTLVEIPVEVETPDHHYYHLAFFTTRKVKAMEELTWDYGIDFDDHEHPIKAFRCQCGSKFCRNVKRSRRARR